MSKFEVLSNKPSDWKVIKVSGDIFTWHSEALDVLDKLGSYADSAKIVSEKEKNADGEEVYAGYIFFKGPLPI